MNEPISALERIAEELEYSELLDAAAAAKDPIERLTLVATFAISATSGNKFRGSRKPLCVDFSLLLCCQELAAWPLSEGSAMRPAS
jgi:hypothetical protein